MLVVVDDDENVQKGARGRAVTGGVGGRVAPCSKTAQRRCNQRGGLSALCVCVRVCVCVCVCVCLFVCVYI